MRRTLEVLRRKLTTDYGPVEEEMPKKGAERAEIALETSTSRLRFKIPVFNKGPSPVDLQKRIDQPFGSHYPPKLICAATMTMYTGTTDMSRVRRTI